MSNQRDLKAFVRYDGSGRVVAGSLVLRKNKPKVGRWKEIQAYECCNYVPTTTTTSSSSTTTTTTTTATPTTTTTTSSSSTTTTTTATPTTTTTTTIEPTTTTTTTTELPECIEDYTIGQAALGGKIAYILQSGDPGYNASLQQGFVATIADVSSGAVWGCSGTGITGADGTAIGTGNQNTIDIMAECPTAGIAARLCGDLIEGGFSDWYLPSKDELNQLYLNSVAIGGFNLDATYWSSSEFNEFQAFIQDFATSAQQPISKNNPTISVRAIRSFSCTIPR